MDQRAWRTGFPRNVGFRLSNISPVGMCSCFSNAQWLKRSTRRDTFLLFLIISIQYSCKRYKSVTGISILSSSALLLTDMSHPFRNRTDYWNALNRSQVAVCKWIKAEDEKAQLRVEAKK